MSSLRVKGYRLSYFYGFIGLKCQVTDCMFQRLSLLIQRIHFLQQAVGIAGVSRSLCLSPIAGSAWFSKGVVSPQLGRRAELPI